MKMPLSASIIGLLFFNLLTIANVASNTGTPNANTGIATATVVAPLISPATDMVANKYPITRDPESP